ncbi:hypothetical protein HPB49_007502 [Dermacentor silvarum]|uniref:Uncharacterized protein n=1 Tax=Dermacentor silvarum TaxID=543639 RepID=A0ACB8CVT6_DERSI|nr:hypothetical protein HPB49_007502 [Dermacentor silvarum]
MRRLTNHYTVIQKIHICVAKYKTSFLKCRWALTARELETSNADARETNAILQAMCHKNGYRHLDSTRELSGMLKADGVHPTQRGSQLLGRLLREAIRSVVQEIRQSHHEVVWQQHQVQEEHEELRRQYGDQSNLLSQHWSSDNNFPVLSSDSEPDVAPTGSSTKKTWAAVVRTSASATVQHCTAVTSTVTEADTAFAYPALSATARPTGKCPVHAPALGGVWVHHKARKTVPPSSAAAMQSPASGGGTLDACCITAKVSPQPEAVVLSKGSDAAANSSSGPCGEGQVEVKKGADLEQNSHVVNGMKKRPTKKRFACAPALVGGVWVHHKARKTVPATVPPSSAAAMQSPASGGGTLDACCITTKDAIAAQLSRVLGAKRVRINLRGNVVAVDCEPGANSSPLLAVSTICGVDVKAKAANNKNVCTGVVFGVDPTFDCDTLAQNIESSAPIVACSCSGRNLVVKFAGSAAPSEVALFKQQRPVRPRRPRPLQCTNCGRYGHIAPTCTGQSRCLRCGGSHSVAECKAPHPKCINCNGRHIATEPRCTRWQQERKVAEIMAAAPQPISRREAMSAAKKLTSSAASKTQSEARPSAHVKPGRTFSQALTGQPALPPPPQPQNVNNSDSQKDVVIAALAAAVKALLGTLQHDFPVHQLCTAALAAHEALTHHG